MIKTILIKDKKTFLKYTLIFFLIFSSVFFSITSLLQYALNESKKNELLNNEQRLIEVENKIVTNKINKITSDLLYVSDCFRMYDKGDGNYFEIEKQWLAFSNRKKTYDQIRFIDADGNEVVRVNYKKNEAIIVDKANLQNKKDRYYFTDTINLSKNQIYISTLDLNMENNTIEEPIKPMLRVSMPYYDQNGKFNGIFILNYSADDMLEQVKEVSSGSNGIIFMLNNNGYWIYDSKNSNNEWSFMYPERVNQSFSNNYPDEWENMQNNKDGYLLSGNGAFIYSNIITNRAFAIDNSAYDIVLGSGDWMLVSYLPTETQNGKLFTQSLGQMLMGVIKDNYIWYLLILMVSVIIAMLISINKNERERIKYFSEYDVMTGAYNRRAGFEKLAQLYKKMSKNDGQISVCFIDINGLKEVNDALGHEAGDELILSVVNGIEKNIRNNDFVARLGGDEFLIIFEGLDEDQSEEIWNRIIKEYKNVNETENRNYLISASHGIETFRFDSNEYIDAIVNNADEKMYNEKRKIKKDLKVLRNI
ncbi:sensor domain-containing diguanylate cyclase [Proteocatella sphenisci]|uniref:sensor domain-containing diguanylate cyclase n=1 Tax=Proteocatella sphenisci TaxID=181070 RepID=UPI00048FADC2|nr:diguanylate cyclase [Proteocatella sphenisci]